MLIEISALIKLVPVDYADCLCGTEIMRKSHRFRLNSPSTVNLNAPALGQNGRTGRPGSRRARGGERNERLPYSPPEDWYEPNPSVTLGSDYQIIVQPPGDGYRHVLLPSEIRRRLCRLPVHMLESLEYVQLSRMTRKKRSFPCYGMQWGSTLYLYPIEESRTEFFDSPPKPAQFNEARMYGGRWLKESDGWELSWSEAAIKDFYLNNILIHELGHLLDSRNTGYVDRERFAESFAIEYGYRRSPRHHAVRRRVRRRHHGT